MEELLKLLQRGKVFGRIELNKKQCEILVDKLKEIILNEKILGIAKTQILGYSQGYKDGLNRKITATEIVARELELNYIREEIKHKYIRKDNIRGLLEFDNIDLIHFKIKELLKSEVE